MNKLHYIDTKNCFGQILLFKDRESAVEWCRKATRWSEEEINKEVKTVSYFNDDSYCSLFYL